MKVLKLNNMTVFIAPDYKALSQKAAEIIEELLIDKPHAALGLATGSTPVGMYQELIYKNQAGLISFKEVSTYNLDEYYPIHKQSKESYHYFMKDKLFNHIDINLENTHIPNGMAKDIREETAAYEKEIRTLGGVDIQVLGIGTNGHIGFNEPSDVFEPSCHRVQLDESTIENNARFFSDIEDVPTEAITMGIGTIMTAKHILLLANGKAKSEAVSQMITQKVTPKLPASILQLHPKVTLVIDEEAARDLLTALKLTAIK